MYRYSAFFWFPFAWYTFFHPFTFSLYVSLDLKWVSCRHHIYGFTCVSSLQCRRPWFNSWVRKFPWRRKRLPISVFMGFLGSSDGKESTSNVGDLCLIPQLGRSPGGGHGNPLQYSCLENPHGQRSLVGYCPCGGKEMDTTERLSTQNVEASPPAPM